MRPAHWKTVLCLGAALATSSGAAFAQKTQLLVYTALETDQLKAYEQGFYKEVPDVEIRWVRDSTGVITHAGRDVPRRLHGATRGRRDEWCGEGDCRCAQGDRRDAHGACSTDWNGCDCLDVAR
jgi:hypothetical protein